MAEAEVAGDVRIALDELGETIPRLRVERGFRVTFQHLRYELSGEARAEHRSPAQECTVGERQAVDATRHDALDALRQRLDIVVARACGGDELLHEERIATGSLDDGRELVGREIVGSGRGGELLSVRFGNRIETKRQCRHRWRALGGDEPASRWAAGRADRAMTWRRRASRGVAGDRRKPRPSSVRPRRATGSAARAAPSSSASMTPFRRARRNDGCSSSVCCVERTETSSTSATSGIHGTRSGSISGDALGQSFAVRHCIAVDADVEQAAQQLPKDEVRRRRLILARTRLTQR